MRIKSVFTPKVLARTGILAAMAAVLFVWPEIPIIPPIYKLDFSNVPVIIAGFSMGTLPGIVVLLIKDLVGLTHSTTAGVGELADFIVSLVFLVVTLGIRNRKNGKQRTLVAMLTGTLFMAVTGALTNYFILIPFYIGTQGMTVEKIIDMIAQSIPAVDSLWKLILYATLPFNLFKGVAVSGISIHLYMPLKKILTVKKEY